MSRGWEKEGEPNDPQMNVIVCRVVARAFLILGDIWRIYSGIDIFIQNYMDLD